MLDSHAKTRRVVGAVLGGAIGLAVVGMTAVPSPAAPPDRPTKVRAEGHRASPGAVVNSKNAAYEYAPAIIKEGDKYRMWWCAQVPNDRPVKGDDILYAESTSLDGPFHAPNSDKPYTVAFHGTGGDDFDRQHTCDPSVVKVKDTYYLYYGAAKNDQSGNVSEKETTLGVAKSSDGIKFERIPGGPIVTPSHQKDNKNPYGAGQPSAVYLNDKFYLMFTDTTGAGTESNGAGQFFWKSSDPTFRTGTEAYTKDGWKPKTAENSRSFSIVNAFSADIQYSDVLKSWIVAHDNEPGKTLLTFLDNAEPKAKPYDQLSIEGKFAEGPGIVSTPDKHSIAGPTCDRFPADVIHADHNAPNNGPPQELRHYGVDLVTDAKCPTPTPTPSQTPSTDPTGSPSATPSQTPSGSASPSTSATPSQSPTPGLEPGGDTNGGNGGSDGSLPITGSNVAMIAGGGGLLLAVGLALFFLARRRHTTN